MIVLGLRTDKPEAEIWLWQDGQVTTHAWQAHRELAATIHTEIAGQLEQRGKRLDDIDRIVVFQGPGSFTGLRIGITVANTLAYGLGVPIVGTMGDDWFGAGVDRLAANENDNQVLPEYGAPVHITPQKK